MGSGARAGALARGLLITALAGLAPSAAAAQPSPSGLSLDAPEGCPDVAALESEIASLVGRAIEEIPLPEGLDRHIAIAREAGRFTLSVSDADGVRRLRDGSCSALVRAAALIIALRIDADAATLAAASAAEAPATSAGPTTSDAAAGAPPTDAAPSATADARPRARYEYDAFEWSRRLSSPYAPPTLPPFAIGVGVFAEAGVVPVISASLAVDLVVRVDRFETRVRIAYVVEEAQPASFGVVASAVLGTALACGRPFEADFPLAFCGGLEAGPLIARSFGVTNAADTASWTLAGVAGLWLPLIPWPGIDIALGTELWIRVYRPDFQIEGIGSVWDADAYGGRFGLLVHYTP